MEQIRPAIIRMHENGYSDRQISETLSISKSTVKKNIIEKSFQEAEKTRNKKVSGFL